MPSLLDLLKDNVPGFLDGDSQESLGTYMRSPNVASSVFGLDNSYFTAAPFLGFEFYVKLYYNSNAGEHVNTIFTGLDSNSSTTLVKNISMPSIGINTDKINEYNRQRINQQRVEFGPAKITFHDVVGGLTMKVWQAYYEYYFLDGDHRVDSTSKQIGKTNPEEFFPGQFGYNLPSVQNDKYLFKKMEIYQVQGGQATKTTLFNPRITSFDHDTLAYDTSDAVEINMTFDYEWLTYDFYNQWIEADDIIPSDVYEYFSLTKSNGFEIAAFENFAATATGSTSTATAGVAPAVSNVQTALGTLKTVKKEASAVLAKAASASALFNQIQIDVLGVDEPIVNAPDIRDFSAVITNIPTSYPDIRRVARKVKN